MNIKRLLLVLLLIIPFVSICQKTDFNITYNSVYTEKGKRIDIFSEKDNNDSYRIFMIYRYSFWDDENTYITINIPSNKTELFKSQMRQIQAKYKEWSSVAKENNVQFFTKTIPVQLTAISEITGKDLYYPDNTKIEAGFSVVDYEPSCIISCYISGKDSSGFSKGQTCNMILYYTDFDTIIHGIDAAIQSNKNQEIRERKAQKEKDSLDVLFH